MEKEEKRRRFFFGKKVKGQGNE
ncbi:hypothetical protein RO1_16500 [Roseburia intestinalis XB6B4]|nr:hypothetical protein ROI_30590 [Roseburia intestinalis M50/1]CBL12241.1 hypothetical protein RO1_16500 [Roseburia intestinalis XB6B4]